MKNQHHNNLPEDVVKRKADDRQSLQRRETENFLKGEINKYPDRQKKFWRRDYSSMEKYLYSVEVNRKRWFDIISDFSEEISKALDVEEEPFFEDENVTAKWVSLKLSDDLWARAILGLPKKTNKTVPLIICQHGISSSPENVFGFDDKKRLYNGYGLKLVEEGFTVLAPLNLNFGYSDREPRIRCNRIAVLLGKSLVGLEIFKIRCLVDFVSTLKVVDENRIGMWGLSMGGTYTLFTLPVELRIKAGIISAFFNHRLRKMTVEDPKYSCYLPIFPSGEEMCSIHGWLREFTDSDLVSLICPRPLMIQTGKADGVSWWPFVLDEFSNAKKHYEKLDMEDRIEMVLHNGGHEIRFREGLDFFKRWL